MTDLEWFNEELEGIDKHINYLKEEIIKDAIFEGLVNQYKKDIKDLEGIKQRLQQIKAKLEAWEVSKRFNIKVEELVNGTYKAYIYYAGISIDVPLSKEEYINFKKALEVEDNG